MQRNRKNLLMLAMIVAVSILITRYFFVEKYLVSEFFGFTKSIAKFSIFWLLPAFSIWGSVSTDHEKKIFFSNGISAGSIGTGEIIPGDPEKAEVLAHSWIAAYPFEYLYFTNIWGDTLSLTSFDKIDWSITYILIPIFIYFCSLIPLAPILMLDENGRRLNIKASKIWHALVGVFTINLLIWIIIKIAPMIFKFTIGLFS